MYLTALRALVRGPGSVAPVTDAEQAHAQPERALPPAVWTRLEGYNMARIDMFMVPVPDLAPC